MEITLLSSIRLKHIHISTLLVGLLCLVSCKKDSVVSGKVVVGESKVKLINTTSSPLLNFYIDDVKLTDQPLAFGESTVYLKVLSGNRNISTSNTSESTASLVLVPTLSYTSFYVQDKAGQGDILTFEDDLGSTETGKARIRFINASPNFSNAINVNLTGSTLLVNSLAFKEASGYFSIDPNEDLRVSVLGTGGVKIFPGTAFEEGKIYTIWFSGSSNANLTINKITYN